MSCRFLPAVLALVLFPLAARAQQPEPLKNLQYFPKDTTRDDLMQTMRGFSFALGVRCEYCHMAKDGAPPQERNFASDEKQTKRTARAMLRMVDSINQQYISKLESKAEHKVECATCHHRLSKPVTMNALLADTMEKQDLAAAITLYRDLRARVYGGGQYDFGETPLNILTESLLRQKKTKEAAAIMELNVEVNQPPSMWASNLLAMAHTANKETEKAKADYQKILQRDPNNAFAKKQLEQLNSTVQ
ncbi:MAG TPA: c-type cytochrome [Candidatus Limnocylindrales bacterium]|nr:c-type cytochrome [Candidatus Limnocylindrales bacterium]